MGTYHKLVNMTRREVIDPSDHGDWANKWRPIHSPGHPLPVLCMVAMLGRWSGDRLEMACDEADDGSPGGYWDPELKDVTREFLIEARRQRFIDEQDCWSDEAWAATTPNARQEWKSST